LPTTNSSRGRRREIVKLVVVVAPPIEGGSEVAMRVFWRSGAALSPGRVVLCDTDMGKG